MNTDIRGEGLEQLSPTNWLYKYLKYTDQMESPSAFHIWSGLSAMSCCLARKVWINRGFYTLYPNQYIILVAESAFCRKSTAVSVAINDLLQTAQIATINKDKMTAEKLCVELSKAEKEQKLDNALTIFVPELATFLGASAFHSGIIPLLTSFYECPSSADYKTKASGEFHMSNVCINLVGATTLDWMSTNLPGDTVEGGFTGRVIFVVAEEPRLSNPWPELSQDEILLRTELIQDLVRINNFMGAFKITTGARDEFSKWYNHRTEGNDLRLRGYYGRKGDHVLKIALCISAGDEGRANGNLEIDSHHIRIALRLLNKAEKLMHLAFRGTAFSKSSKDIDRILGYMIREGLKSNLPVKHSLLLKRNSHYLNGTEFKEVMNTLMEQGDVKMVSKPGAKGVFYDLTEQQNAKKV
jgi:hypothetical protein|tara:strand:- start:432 stop:1667 length:1236 start_codon:yes stop_codon:yes gene_type:complete